MHDSVGHHQIERIRQRIIPVVSGHIDQSIRNLKQCVIPRIGRILREPQPAQPERAGGTERIDRDAARPSEDLAFSRSRDERVRAVLVPHRGEIRQVEIDRRELSLERSLAIEVRESDQSIGDAQLKHQQRRRRWRWTFGRRRQWRRICDQVRKIECAIRTIRDLSERFLQADFGKRPLPPKNRGKLKVHIQFIKRTEDRAVGFRERKSANGKRKRIGVELDLIDCRCALGQRRQALEHLPFDDRGNQKETGQRIDDQHNTRAGEPLEACRPLARKSYKSHTRHSRPRHLSREPTRAKDKST